jgi:hypothetical protein
VIIHKTEEVTILLQDPQYGAPHMLPERLNDLMTILDSQRQQLPLNKWLLPEMDELMFHIDQLTEEGELSDTNKNTLLRELELLCDLWKCALKKYYSDNEFNVTYDVLKIMFFPNGLKRKMRLWWKSLKNQ